MAPTRASESKASPTPPKDDNADSPVNETAANDDGHHATAEPTIESTVTEEQLDGMHTVLNNVYRFRTADGEDPSKLFQRKVNRRILPDYYDVIKEPMAMSTIKAKLANREYKAFEEFVRDWALISHNAQVYNSPNAQAYVDALVIKDVVSKQLQLLVDQGVITKEVSVWPFLGEIPPADEVVAEEEEEEEDDEEEEEDDEEDEEEDEEDGRKKRKRGRISTAAKRESKGEEKEKDEDPELRKKRGRPPRVDTPMEARIKAIMKGLRKPKNSNGDLMILSFERLPDKQELPDYFNEIKNPMALDGIKRKLKRKKYTSVDQFMRDVNLMFDNAKQYNQDESQIYKDAVELQQEGKSLAEAEKAKPDSDFTMEDGRIPMPEGILHNGEVWKVGDWVHIQNANDLTKPIVAQIYRTWRDQDGAKWVNACWYYRPEQTIHRFDRHFYENEVMKTGQYRDHPIDEVIDRCFVMFFTRYNKGRPRNFPADKEVYVCECRYNEEKHKLNKIKTWASCLPDEVRDKDYEMDLYDAPKKLKKVPSPIKYLFKEGEQKETDDLPKPIWGAPNAPPKIGAVHTRPRDPKDSPPPEPTPTPPPQPPPQPIRQMSSHHANGYPLDRPNNINTAAANTPRHNSHQMPTSQALATPGSYTPGHGGHVSQYHPSPSPAPGHAQLPHSNSYAGHHAPSFPHHPAQQQVNYNSPAQHSQVRQAQGPPPAYKAPNQVEVWHLPDSANASIPEDIRNQFQQDANGRVLFFTAPPAVSSTDTKKKLKHTPGYLAFRAKQIREKLEAKKRRDNETTAGAEQPLAKKARMQEPPTFAELEFDENGIPTKAIEYINDLLMDSTIAQLKATHGEEGAKQALEVHMDYVSAAWQARADERERTAQAQAERMAKAKAESKITGLSRLLDYKPPNEQLEWPDRH
ncbi:Bromodomain-containing protein [Microthyrium microscopicum]|uniref:Bromodomain-containing protein n=1 Tax=Microthyrium microscopicum TaxID=703497 RepID=A0A6A6TXR3_9PEZI|nr:Bromodomain-containing protein [Microthyrium microscopicum]